MIDTPATPSPSDSGREQSSAVTDRLKAFAVRFDGRFEAFLKPHGDVPSELLDAVRHTVLAPGKRLRPYLVGRCAELVGGSIEQAWAPAAAIECIHAFSLIHDDLPAMDDDGLRRGRPTCHKVFGDAIAILAGDALAVLPFEILIRHVPDRGTATALVFELARGAGWAGMIGGQAADITGERKPPERSIAEYIHERKTARLFESACRLGGSAGGGDAAAVDNLGRFGQMFGRAFQITDDLLDLTSTADAMGKGVAKDATKHKQTFPACVGIEASRAAAEAASVEAIEALDRFGPVADDLRDLARYVVDRNY